MLFFMFKYEIFIVKFMFIVRINVDFGFGFRGFVGRFFFYRVRFRFFCVFFEGFDYWNFGGVR